MKRTHGLTRSREHNSWRGMCERCRNPKHPSWQYYGAKGISVYPEWTGLSGFERFLAYMGPRPPGMSLDRIDSSGNYEPGNVRWADKWQQSREGQRGLARARDVKRAMIFAFKWKRFGSLYSVRDTFRMSDDVLTELETQLGPPRNMDAPTPGSLSVESFFWDEDFDVNFHTLDGRCPEDTDEFLAEKMRFHSKAGEACWRRRKASFRKQEAA